MINGLSVLAVVTARSGSKGLPGKNIKELAGKPLLAWPIEAAKSATHVDTVIISTDSKEYARIAESYGAECPFLRDIELAADTTTSVSVIQSCLAKLKSLGNEFDIVVMLEPTSPLTTGDDIDSALESLIEGMQNGAESIVGVVQEEIAHPDFLISLHSDGVIRPFSTERFGPAKRRQDISKVYRFEGSLYISLVSALKQKNTFYHDNTLGYEVPKWKSFEVDDMLDFVCIEAIVNNMDQIKNG